MKLTSIYYSPSVQKLIIVGLIKSGQEMLQKDLIKYNYELIGYFYDN